MALTIGLLSMPVGVVLGFVAARMTYRGEMPVASALIVGLACMGGTITLLLDIADLLR